MQDHSNTSVESLAVVARSRREAMQAAKRQHQAGSLDYQDLEAAACAFCGAFYAYQVAKYGKKKARKPDYRYVLRAVG